MLLVSIFADSFWEVNGDQATLLRAFILRLLFRLWFDKILSHNLEVSKSTPGMFMNLACFFH